MINAQRSALLALVLVPWMISCGGGGGGTLGLPPDLPAGPVTVTIAQKSVTLETGQSFQFNYSVTNSSNTNVIWKVNDLTGGDATFGTISTEGVYTAPASVPTPNPVTVKAASQADSSKYDTAAVTINPRFAISPETASVKVGSTQQFTATLPVDNWEVNGLTGGNATIGTISSSGLYTAPATVPSPNTVTVRAIKQGDTSKTASATVTITASETGMTVLPSSVTVGAGLTQQFTASQNANWEVIGATGTDPATWGTIDGNGLYTAPLTPPWMGKVTIKASSKTDSTNSATSIVTVVFSNASLNGRYALRYRVYDTDGILYVVGSIAMDGRGAISGGFLDFMRPGGAPATAPLTGTYIVNPDGRASATLTVQISGGSASLPLRLSLLSNVSARVIDADDTGAGWGNLDQQDASAFSSGLSGPYVFYLDGLDSDKHPLAIAGRFNASSGSIGSGLEDINDNGATTQYATFTGTYTNADPSTGRAGVSLNVGGKAVHFFLYMLARSAFVFISGDQDVGYIGAASQSDGSTYSKSTLSGNVVFVSLGYSVNPQGTAGVAGILTADGNGTFTQGLADNNVNGTIGTSLSSGGNYNITSDGRGILTVNLGGTVSTWAAYPITNNYLYYVSLSRDLVSTGQFLPQTSGTYSNSSLRGNLSFSFRETLIAAKRDITGLLISDGAGNLTGTADINKSGDIQTNVGVIGTCAISANGRGELSINWGSSTDRYALYLASGRTMFLVPINSGALPSVGYINRQF